MQALGDLLGSPEFRWGFVFSVVAGCVVVGAHLMLPSVRPKRRGLLGPAWVGAALLATAGWFGLPQSWIVPWHVPVALAAIFLGGEIAAHSRGMQTSWPWRVALVMPGAAILAFGNGWGWGHPYWLSWMVFLGVALCAPLVTDFDRRSARLGLGPVLFLVSLAGVWAYLPENDLIRGLLGAALPLALLGIPFRLERLGEGGTAAAVGLYFWAIAYESNGTRAQVWLMVFALGLPLVEPMGRRFARSATRGSVLRRYQHWIGIGGQIPTVALQALIFATDIAFVVYVCRVVGFSERYPGDSAQPLLLLLPAVVGGIFFGVVLGLSPRFRFRSLFLDSRGGARPRRRARAVGSRQTQLEKSSVL